MHRSIYTKKQKCVGTWVKLKQINAAYSQDMDIARLNEIKSFQMFVEKLCELDKSEAIYCMLWDEFSTNIRLLINKHYVF